MNQPESTLIEDINYWTGRLLPFLGPSIVYAPLGLRVRVSLRVRSVISVSFRVRVSC